MINLLFSLLLAPAICFAQADAVVQSITEGARIEQLLNTAKSRATADLTEAGTNMVLTYSSPETLDVLILYMQDGEFDPLDSLVVTLPAGTRNTVDIDLTKSAGWLPYTRTYRLHFLSRSTEGASFEDIEFSGPRIPILATLKQLLRPLPYTPSSYHRLPAYKVYDIPLTLLIGCALVVVCLGLIIRGKRGQAVLIAASITLLFQARFSVDLLRYSTVHLHEWFTENTYATAGSLPSISSDLQNEKATGVYLCHTGTSYARRILAYHAYPVLLTDASPSHVVVHAATDWSYNRGVLRCGTRTFRATELASYNDGSSLYQVQP